MDDSFTFRTTVPIRRRIDPRGVKAAVVLSLVVVVLGLFANWVVASERRSFARAERRGATSEIAVTQIGAAAPAASDADARKAARDAVLAARAAHADHRSFLDAHPARLSELQPAYIYVDGPSTAPHVVSVASTARSWAAAVAGADGACFWIRITESGGVTRGTSPTCTGAAALTAPDEDR